MRIKLVLDDGDDTLFSVVLDDYKGSKDLTERVVYTLQTWMLYPGDTIRLVEMSDEE